MFYVLGIAFVVMLLARFMSPKRENVKASRPGGVRTRPDRWIMSGFAVNIDGTPVRTRDKFVARVDGLSMAQYGIPEGATVIGDYLDSEQKKQVSDGDIVVAKAAFSADSHLEYCLRRVQAVNGNQVEFYDDNGGCHPSHNVNDLEAIITSFVPPRKLRGLFDQTAKAA